MSIEEIVLSNIKNVVIEPDFDDNGYCYFNIVIVNDDDSEKYKKYSDLYINYLSKKFNSNPEQLPYRTRNKYNEAKNGVVFVNRRDNGYDITPSRVIANYIAGMTDRYALENYKRMFE